MSSSTAETITAAEAGYGCLEPVRVHHDDLDLMGILHNARYQILVERAITAFWIRAGWHQDPARSRLAERFFAVREATTTFHVPIAEPGEPLVHFWVERIGSSSMVYGFRILSADGATVHAEGSRVQVRIDPATLRPVPLSAATRALASGLLREPAESGA